MFPIVFALIVLLCISADASQECGAASGQEPSAVSKVQIAELTRNAEALLDREVLLEGVLANKSKNYFARPRIVLRDDAGAEVGVRPWLPLSVPPPATGSDVTRPTLADYLGKRVRLKAILRRQGPDKPFILDVQHAEIVPGPAR